MHSMCTVEEFLEKSNGNQKATDHISTGLYPFGRTGLKPVTDPPNPGEAA